MRKPMFFLTAIFLFIWLVSCHDEPKNFSTYVDLNGDGKPEIVFGEYGQDHFTYTDYDLVAKFSDDTRKEPRLIKRFIGRPDQIHFVDIDNDGDSDLVFSVYGHDRFLYTDYDTYVSKNDGSGNFGDPELINRQHK